jgi:hypothetical protein
MMGMMTLVRVLPDKEYEEMMARIKTGSQGVKEEHHHES